DNAGEIVPVADEISEDAREQRFLHQSRDDVVVAAPRPEQRCQRDVDGDQRGGDEGHLGLKQPESAVDILGENPKETIDDAGATHVLTRLPTLEGTASAMAADFDFLAARAPGY